MSLGVFLQDFYRCVHNQLRTGLKKEVDISNTPLVSPKTIAKVPKNPGFQGGLLAGQVSKSTRGQDETPGPPRSASAEEASVVAPLRSLQMYGGGQFCWVKKSGQTKVTKVIVCNCIAFWIAF